jgi:ribosomal protein S18 acetylase RimI-like enzyme
MPKTAKESEVKIRRARITDAARLATLASELGYPTAAREMKKRLDQVLRERDHIALVAEKNGDVIGWLHLSVSHLLDVPVRCEINGLIVAEGQRSAGAGAKMLEVGEKWARKKKCTGMSVRSNVIRERAHAFYERQGYEHYKTSKAFRKPL